MIHFLVGKPRSGKSLRAVAILYEQLTTTERLIVTNMRLDLAELQAYCDGKGFELHVWDRIREISDEQTPYFFLVRECAIDANSLTLSEPADKKKGMVDYTPVFEGERFYSGGKKIRADGTPASLKGVCYILDEIHTHFPARDYQRTGVHLPFYLSQHGKLNDMVVLITQNLKFCDPELYRAAQDFTYCRNRRIEKYGMFRGDNRLEAKTYFSPLTNPDAQAAALVVTYKIDGLAKCYDTSAGVGMPGGGTADGGHRAKGIPLKTVFIGMAAVLALGWFMFAKVLPRATNKFLVPALGGKTDNRNVIDAFAEHKTAPLKQVALFDEVKCEGFVKTSTGPIVFLTDGSTRTLKSGVQKITDEGVTINGKLFLYQQTHYLPPTAQIKKPAEAGS